MKGPVAQAIVDVVHSLGGLLTLEDLKAHQSTIDTPISVNYRGTIYHSSWVFSSSLTRVT